MSVYEVEVPGQHKSTGYRCSQCGTDYGSFTLGCRRCSQRHGWRRRKSKLLRARIAPTKGGW